MRNEIAAIGAGRSKQKILDTMPKIIALPVILIVGWIVAKAVRRIVDVIVPRSEAYRRGQEDGKRGAGTPAETPAPGPPRAGSGAGNTSGIA